ncbi:MAG: hypothetical protein RLZ28_400 [Actinomycetota bacterium]|jgi:hypothetical protein
MQRKRFIFLLILLTSAVFTSLEAGADPGLALARSLSFRTQNCVPESTKPGFNLGGENRGSSVTLCAKFIVDKTVLKPNPRPKPSVLPVSSGANTVEPKKTKPDHRRMVSKSGNTFSPSASPIMATPKTVKPRQPVKLQISSSRQYRTAYLLGKFVALRFTPLRAELHLNPQSRSKIKTTGPFSADLTISRSGTWQVRGFINYKAEYRANGSPTWHTVAGELQLPAKPASIKVSKPISEVDPKPSTQKHPYLVFEDCLNFSGRIGCLN